MARARIYPKADAKTQWWEGAFARGTFSGIEKILLHTTETTGWPGYKSGSAAPTLTYHPRLRQWRQHNYLDRSARALVDPAGTLVRENRDNVIQIEIIAYSDEPLGRSVGGLPVSELTDAQLGDLAAFIKFIRAEYGGPPLVAPRFLPYPQSAGDSSVRMSGPQYDAFKGVLGHQHASGNGHGDPGSLNVQRILALAGASTAAPAPAPVVKEDDMANVSDKQLQRLLDSADRILGAFPQRYIHDDGTVTFSKGDDGKAIRYADSADVGSALGQLKGENANLRAQLGGVSSTVVALSKGQVLTADQILEAARAGATAALDSKITNADVSVNLNVAAPPQA